MTPEEKIVFYGLVTTVALLVSQIAILQGQVAIIDQQITDLTNMIPDVPEELNYTITDAISNFEYESYYVVAGDYQLTIDGPQTVVQGYPHQVRTSIELGLDTIPELPHWSYSGRAATWVIVVHYDNFNATEALDGIGVETDMAEWMIGFADPSFNATIVGNCIEFTFSEHYIGGSGPVSWLTVELGMPVGEYIILQYFRA